MPYNIFLLLYHNFRGCCHKTVKTAKTPLKLLALSWCYTHQLLNTSFEIYLYNKHFSGETQKDMIDLHPLKFSATVPMIALLFRISI